MSRKLFAFLLSELKTVRIICNDCRTASEIPIDRLAKNAPSDCPGCSKNLMGALINSGSSTPKQLAAIIESLAKAKEFEIEFVVPDRE
jgi:hypothetical protein